MTYVLPMRVWAWVAAVLVVAAAVAMMLSHAWRVGWPAPLEAPVVLSITERASSGAAAPAPLARRTRREDATPDAPPLSTSQAAALAAVRCATLEQRRRNPDCAQGPAFADASGRDLAPEPVQGLQTREGAVQRAILRGINARAENYALGEAQKHADPRADPLYEEGTDPATAAMRPCPAGSEPRGDGRDRRGRTCQPLR